MAKHNNLLFSYSVWTVEKNASRFIQLLLLSYVVRGADIAMFDLVCIWMCVCTWQGGLSSG